MLRVLCGHELSLMGYQLYYDPQAQQYVVMEDEKNEQQETYYSYSTPPPTSVSSILSSEKKPVPFFSWGNKTFRFILLGGLVLVVAVMGIIVGVLVSRKTPALTSQNPSTSPTGIPDGTTDASNNTPGSTGIPDTPSGNSTAPSGSPAPSSTPTNTAQTFSARAPGDARLYSRLYDLGKARCFVASPDNTITTSSCDGDTELWTLENDWIRFRNGRCIGADANRNLVLVNCAEGLKWSEDETQFHFVTGERLCLDSHPAGPARVSACQFGHPDQAIGFRQTNVARQDMQFSQLVNIQARNVGFRINPGDTSMNPGGSLRVALVGDRLRLQQNPALCLSYDDLRDGSRVVVKSCAVAATWQLSQRTGATTISTGNPPRCMDAPIGIFDPASEVKSIQIWSCSSQPNWPFQTWNFI
jgi:hypothetical protein